MAVKHQAIRPDYFGSFRDLITKQKQKEAEAKGVDEEENHLYAMSESAGWRILNQYINNLIIDLERISTTQMAKGASFEEIGRNAVTVQLVKDLLLKIVNKVNDAREAVERGTKEGGDI